MDATVEGPPPPPPASNLPPELRTSDATITQHPPAAPASWGGAEGGTGEGGGRGRAGSDYTGSDGYDTQEGDDSPRAWAPITEDLTVPCEDELEFLVSKGERSALDHEYWEKEMSFDVEDPELVPGESGRIDWLVEAFNGTEDNPNNEEIMRSPVVRVGGLDWQIKFHPKGHGSKYLSVYLECISMLESDYAETEEFHHPPFPFLKDASQIRKRRSVAAQFLVVMYNPEEPRVYEHRSEAHQFHKKQADYGWVYFSKYPRGEFHIRQHTQRQAILRNDKLAFKAYVRIIEDPTGSKWEHSAQRGASDQIVSVTGLRPFRKSSQYVAGAVPLLHFAPFRRLVHEMPADTQLAEWLQPLLLKMYSRQRSSTHNARGTYHEGDVMEMMWKMSALFNSENDPALVQQWQEIVGVFDLERGSACGVSRLNTKEYVTIQDAVDHHPKTIVCPQLLTMELTRQEHDKKTRKWKKITNSVRLNDHIQVNGSQYTLFAFITHCGHLMSSKYNTYVRPNGVGKGWYGYHDGLVTRLTEKQARDRYFGSDLDDRGRSRSPHDGYDSVFSNFHETKENEVPSIVMYVRDDVAVDTFNAAPIENFVVPRAAGAATPEPDGMNVGDAIMRDADEGSIIEDDPTDGTTLEKGTFSWLGRCHYEGQWKNGKYHGGGYHIATNGDEYLGSFEKGLKHGFGKMIYADTGDVYEGEWQEDKHHGRGRLTELSSGNVFEGGWLEGKKHGSFTLKGTVTEEDKSRCTICYDQDMTTAFYDCGHVVACRECAARIEICPVCRRRVAARLQLYGVKISSG